MNLRAIYEKLYEFFDLQQINIRLSKEIIGTSTITITTYPDVRYAKKLPSLESEIALYLGISPDDISIEQGEGCFYLILSSPSREELRLSDMLDRFRGYPEIYSNPLNLLIGVDNFDRLITLEIGDRNPHIIIAGSSGSGKSNLLSVIIAQIMDRDKEKAISFVIYSPKSDLSKFEWYSSIIKEIDDIENCLEDICGILERRARGREDKKPILIFLDEVNSLIFSSDKARGYISQIAMKGRSERVHLILAMQSSKRELLQSPIIRENCISRIIFRVHNKRESLTLSNTPEIDCSKLQIGEAYILNHRGYARISIPIDDISSYAKEENVRLGEHSIESRNSQRLQFSKDRNIKKFKQLPEEIRNYLSSEGKARGISKSILVNELKQSQPQALTILRELEELGLLGDKPASNSPSPLNLDRLTALVNQLDRLGAG